MNLDNFIFKNITKEKPTRSEREARIKDKAGLVINFFAALLAINTYISNGLSSTIMNNTIKANDIWNFYQAKSIKQTVYELALNHAIESGNEEKAQIYRNTIARYESDPSSGEGKIELFTEAKRLEAERDQAKKRSPWISYANSAFQLSIVLLSASILSVSMLLFWGSFVVSIAGILLMTQGFWLWF